MQYRKIITLKNGSSCLLRNATYEDGQAALGNFLLTHEQTDYLLSYPDENTFTVEREAQYLHEKASSSYEIELLAELNGIVVGQAGLERVGAYEKLRRRVEFGVSVDKNYWGLGIGCSLTSACVELARLVGYAQIELSVVAENIAAINLYRSVGFVEYGRNPRGFFSRFNGWQELLLMRLELD